MFSRLFSVFFTLTCFWSIATCLPSLSLTSNVTAFKYNEPFLLNCTINGFFPADKFYQIMFKRSVGPLASYQYKRPEKNLQPQVFFAETAPNGVNISSVALNSPQFQIEVTAAAKAIPTDDIFWCEYTEDFSSIVKSNVWKSSGNFNTGPSMALLIALLTIFYLVH